ncbi:DoxX family protein [Allosalinactinospora lopnorensis]|uniref:DoxX family protein n=1 Tax=Allosalinactinospora lopnorensis TaxID=1352348 RepID=UPI000623E385|nr:DoxX family protein [Allosalinactinospora lopnorensis]
MNPSDTQKSPMAKRGRALTIVLWVAQILLAAYFIVEAATPKLLGDPGQVEMFDTIGFGQWFRYFTGICELAGALGLLIPRLAGLAALGLLGVMAGAVLTNLFLIPGSPVPSLLLGIACGLIAWGRWPEIKALAAMLRR